MPIACQYMLANCGANTSRPVWSAYVLHITMPIELCITYPEMSVFAHTRLPIVLGPLMPCWEKTCIDFLYDAHLHPTFLFDRFECLMLFTNLHFSSIFQRSCMETKCSSCPWIVSSVLLLCSKNMWTLCRLHTKLWKVRSAGKCFAPLKVGHVLTPVVWCATVWVSIFCAIANDDTAVVRIKRFAPSMLVMCIHRFCNVRWCIANYFLWSCVCDMDHVSAIN